MKKFVAIAVLFICTFCSVFSQDVGTNWWEREFVIGSFIDPPVVWKTELGQGLSDVIDLSWDAGFNLMTGTYTTHSFLPWWNYEDRLVTYDAIKSYKPGYHVLFQNLLFDLDEDSLYIVNDIDDFLESCWNSRVCKYEKDGLYPFSFDGINIADEPERNDNNIYPQIVNYLKGKQGSDNLYFINLYPCYRYGLNTSDQQTYRSYLEGFLYSGTSLQVACFDNYFPSSYFVRDSSYNKGYYYNLALMRHMADAANIPLWSYINTCEPQYISSRDSIWQSAFMRLGAFAPVAYGAKGLMYFTYDSQHPNSVLDYSRGKTYYLSLPTDTTESFFMGHLRSGDKADYAVKRDVGNGDWFIKYSDSIESNQPDKILQWYGHRSDILPFLCYRPDLGRDVIAGLTNEGSLYLTDTLSGWTHSISLPEIHSSLWKDLTDKKVSSFSLDGNGLDLCVTRTGSDRDTLFIYGNLQMSPANYTHVGPEKIPLNSGERVFQLVRDEGDLYSVTKAGSVFSLCRIYENNSHNVTIDRKALVLPSSYVDHFWIEKITNDSIAVFMQLEPHIDYNKKRIFSGKTSLNGTACYINIPENITDYSRIVYSLRRYGTNIYDRFGIWDKRHYDEALVDGTGVPTQRYYMAKENNLYIRNVLSPVILGAEWKGAWHTAPQGVPMHEIDMIGGYVKMLESASDSILNSMDSNLIAGKFETDSCYYYFFVDKSGENRESCEVRINIADSIIGCGGVSLLPRIQAGRSTLKCEKHLLIHSDSVWRVSWVDMLGGEGVMLKVMKQKPHPRTSYVSRHKGRDLDGDGRDEFILPAQAQITVGYSEGSGWDTGTGMLTQISAGGSGREYVEGDFDGDGRGDICWLDRNLKKFIVKKSSTGINFELPYDSIESSTTSFCADYDGDGKTDICFRSGGLGNMFLDVSSNDFGDIDDKLYIYGTSAFTLPAQGDYDGDGMDDIALLTRDGHFLIDYAKNGFGMWDSRYELPAEVQTVLPYVSVDDVQVGDIDGDGLADVTMSRRSDTIVLTMTGSDGFAIVRRKYLGSASQPVEVLPLCCGDFDGDGIMERAKYNELSNKLLISDYGNNTGVYIIDFRN